MSLLTRCCSFLRNSLPVFTKPQTCASSSRTAICRINRRIYGRMYPVHLVLQNGATIRIRYKEPRCLLQVPINLDECSEEERQRRLLRRKPRTRLMLQEEVEDTFNPDAYSFLWSKKQTRK